MYRRMAFVLLAMMLAPAAMALAQDNPGPGGPGGDGGPGSPPDFQQMRQRMEERLKERLSVSDDQWAVIGPKIEKVRQLQMELRPPRPDFGPGGPRGGPGRQDGNAQPGPGAPGDQGGPPAPDNGGPNGPAGPGEIGPGGPGGPAAPGGPMQNSPVQKAVNELNQVLRSPDAKEDQIKAACAKVRELRGKTKTDLATAQQDLKSVLSARQQAVLLAMGILE